MGCVRVGAEVEQQVGQQVATIGISGVFENELSGFGTWIFDSGSAAIIDTGNPAIKVGGDSVASGRKSDDRVVGISGRFRSGCDSSV